MEGRFYGQLEHVFDKFPKYHMKILLGNFNAKVDKENIFKQIIGNESLHEISNDNGVRVVNFATSNKIDELASNSKNKNIRDLYGGINEFKRSHQPRCK
jgi:hypothetical protein